MDLGGERKVAGESTLLTLEQILLESGKNYEVLERLQSQMSIITGVQLETEERTV